MSTRIHLMNLALAAAAMATTTSMTACDAEGEPSWDADPIDLSDVDFRCSIIGGCGDGEKANNNFVGEKPDYMFWRLPLQPGADPDVELKKIKTKKCVDVTGATLHGNFIVEDPVLSVDSLGAFASFEVHDVTDPTIVCDAYGNALLYSLWFLEGELENENGGLDTVSIKLKISDIHTDSDGRTLFEWKSDHDYLYGNPGTGLLHPTCDEAKDVEAGSGLEFSAMLYNELDVDAADNTFGTMQDVAYIACLSGTVGKTGVLWDYDTTDTVTQQVAANAAMAAYCGDGVSYTQTGTMIDLWRMGANSGPDQSEPGTDFELEAVWNADNEAICIGTTRLPGNQPDWSDPNTQGFSCGSTTLPQCTQQHLDDPAAVLASYKFVGGA